jgi:hypothetical protein
LLRAKNKKLKNKEVNKKTEKRTPKIKEKPKLKFGKGKKQKK